MPLLCLHIYASKRLHVRQKAQLCVTTCIDSCSVHAHLQRCVKHWPAASINRPKASSNWQCPSSNRPKASTNWQQCLSALSKLTHLVLKEYTQEMAERVQQRVKISLCLAVLIWTVDQFQTPHLPDLHVMPKLAMSSRHSVVHQPYCCW